MADVDVDMLFEWIYENVPSHLTDAHDLAMAMDALSIADLYRGRIRATQDWSLTRYVIDFMTAGVAMARQNSRVSGWIPFKFPERVQMLSRSRAERALKLRIGQKVKRRNHISAVRAAREFLPYLRIIFRSNPGMAAGIARWLDLDADMIDYLAESEKAAEEIHRLLK
jgi:replication factor C large subunit